MPSLVSPKISKWFLLLLLPLAAAIVFVALNVADYRRYCYIMELDKHLTPADFNAMAQAIENGPNDKWKECAVSEIPTIFQKLGAKSLRVYRHREGISTNLTLYERGKPRLSE